MSRRRPFVGAGGWYHVTNHGIGSHVPFPTPKARDRLGFALAEAAYGFAIEVHAYCFMNTHYHLLARGLEPTLRRAVTHLESSWSSDLEGAHYCRMAVGRHLLQVTRYIHTNPVKAGIVREPGAWPWSSYHGYLDPLDGPPWLETIAVLGWLGSIGSRQLYRRYVEGSLCRVPDGARP